MLISTQKKPSRELNRTNIVDMMLLLSAVRKCCGLTNKTQSNIVMVAISRVAFLSNIVYRYGSSFAFHSSSSAVLANTNINLPSARATCSSSTMVSMSPQDLIGKTFDIEYASDHSKDTYRFKMKDTKKIDWKRIKGTDVGKEGDQEDYVITQLTDEKLLVTWIEADGLGLTNVLDFTEGSCLTHGNNGRAVWKHTGKLTLIED